MSVDVLSRTRTRDEDHGDEKEPGRDFRLGRRHRHRRVVRCPPITAAWRLACTDQAAPWRHRPDARCNPALLTTRCAGRRLAVQRAGAGSAAGWTWSPGPAKAPA